MGALNSIFDVINKHVEVRQSQYDLLRVTTCYCSPFGHRAIDCNSLDMANQPVIYPSNSLSIKTIFLQFRDRDG